MQKLSKKLFCGHWRSEKWANGQKTTDLPAPFRKNVTILNLTGFIALVSAYKASSDVLYFSTTL
jgi:hypothetical protein